MRPFLSQSCKYHTIRLPPSFPQSTLFLIFASFLAEFPDTLLILSNIVTPSETSSVVHYAICVRYVSGQLSQGNTPHSLLLILLRLPYLSMTGHCVPVLASEDYWWLEIHLQRTRARTTHRVWSNNITGYFLQRVVNKRS